MQFVQYVMHCRSVTDQNGNLIYLRKDDQDPPFFDWSNLWLLPEMQLSKKPHSNWSTAN